MEAQTVKTALQELKSKLQEVADEIDEDFKDGSTNQYNTGYKEAMLSVIKDIDAQMLAKERQYIIDSFNQGYREGEIDGVDEGKVLPLDVSEYDNATNYFNQTFNH